MTTTLIEAPAARAAHAILNAIQVARSLVVSAHGLPPNTAQANEIAARIDELLAPAVEDVAALQQYIDRQEANIATMLEESLERERALTAERATNDALRHQLAGANQLLAEAQTVAEELVRDMAPLVGAMSTLFTRARSIRLYNDVPSRPYSISHHEQPRAAAGRL